MRSWRVPRMLLVFSSTFLALSIFIYGQSFDSKPYFSGKAIARIPVVSNDLNEASPLQGVSAPALVRAASGSIHSGGGTVALPVEVLDVQNLGAATITVGFDPAVLKAIQCERNAEFEVGLCNRELDRDNDGEADAVRFNVVSLAGMGSLPAEPLMLAEITWQTLGLPSGGNDGLLEVEIGTFTDTDAIPIEVTAQNGHITVLPSDTSTSTLTITPTPSPTSSPTPSPTCTHTASPTSTDTPSSTPSPISTSTSTIIPTQTPTPSPTATRPIKSTRTPTPTAMATHQGTDHLRMHLPYIANSTSVRVTPVFECHGWCLAGSTPDFRRQKVDSNVRVNDWRMFIGTQISWHLDSESDFSATAEAAKGSVVRIDALWDDQWLLACKSIVKCTQSGMSLPVDKGETIASEGIRYSGTTTGYDPGGVP